MPAQLLVCVLARAARGIFCVSAGDQASAWTTACALSSIFRYFDDKLIVPQNHLEARNMQGMLLPECEVGGEAGPSTLDSLKQCHPIDGGRWVHPTNQRTMQPLELYLELLACQQLSLTGLPVATAYDVTR